MLLFGLKI